MSAFVLPGGQAFQLDSQPVPMEPGVLSTEQLEHGVYYAGKLAATPVIARWHAKKRRFVFGEYALGGQRVRSVTHVADGATGEQFAPHTKTEPTAAYRVSDYAFETAG